jgi:hypothetical protein
VGPRVSWDTIQLTPIHELDTSTLSQCNYTPFYFNITATCCGCKQATSGSL